MALVQSSSALGGAASGSAVTGHGDAAGAPPALSRNWAGTILDWNPGCERLFGLSASVARGQDADRLLGRVLPLPRPVIEAALLQQGCWSGEIRHRLPDGRALTLAVHWRLDGAGEAGRPTRVVETLIDLTGSRAGEADGRAVTDALPAPLFVSDAAGRNIHVNRGFQDYTGLPEAALLGDGWLTALHPGDRERAAAAWARAVREGGPYEAEYRFRRADGAWRRVLVRGAPVRGADGAILRWCGVCTDVEGLRGAEAALAQEQARLSLAQEAGGLGLWDRDLATDRLWASPTYRALYGLPAEGDLSPGTWLSLVHPEDRPKAEAAARATVEGGLPFFLRFRILRADNGALRWIEARGRHLADPEGGPGRFLGVSMDVTAQQAEEERTTLLTQEIDHRSRNVLATVQALLRLTRAESPEAYARALEGRIAALGRAQALLLRERWTGAELRVLLEAEFAPYAGQALTGLALHGPALTLAPAAVQPLSMAVHELVTNAAKHGALSQPGGRVTITWSIGADHWLRLEWREEGGPTIPGTPGRRGFGSSLLRSLLAAQLGGSVEKLWEPGGLRCRFALPPGVLAAASEQAMNHAMSGPEPA